MFLNWASVLRHITATEDTKPCREANMGIQEIQLEARAGGVMAGGEGRGGEGGRRRTSDISRQVTCWQKSKTVY